MRNLALRYCLVLTAILICGWLYSLTAVRWIEGSVARGSNASAQPTETNRKTIRHDIAELFPKDAWELDKCIRLETEQGLLFLQKYEQLDGQRLQVEPLTVVFRQDADDESDAQPVILSSPEGAVIRFSEDFALGSSQLGKLEYAWLKGEVVIRRPASVDRDDELRVETSNITVNEQRITTPNAVKFQFGPHHGEGRNLTLDLVERQGKAKAKGSFSSFGDLGMLEVVNLKRMVLAPSKKQIALTGNANSSPTDSAAPTEIQCQGPFRFDFEKMQASFSRAVNVSRQEPQKLVVDRLQCDLLVAQFTSSPSPTNVARKPEEQLSAVDRMQDLALESLQAYGSPAQFDIPSQLAHASAEAMLYEPDTGRIVLDDSKQISLSQDSFLFETRRLEYFLNDNNRLGNATAQGPGKMVRRESEKSARLEVSWQDELKIRPDQGLKAISLYGQPQLLLGSDQSFEAGEVHLWIDEVDSITGMSAGELTETQQEEAKWKIIPVKMLAIASDQTTHESVANTNQIADRYEVQFDSPRTGAKTDHLEVFFARPTREELLGQRTMPLGNAERNPVLPTSIESSSRSRDSRLSFEPRNTPATEQRMGKLICSGDLTRLRLTPDDESYAVDELTVGGNVSIEEVALSDPSIQPLRLHGHVLQATSRGADFFYLIIRGSAEEHASVSARGLSLFGEQINLDQLANQAWIDGPGRATVVQPSEALRELNRQTPQFAADRMKYDRPTTISWRDHMAFDGQRVEVHGGVQAEGTRWTDKGERTDWNSMSEKLDVDLTDRIRLAETEHETSRDDVELHVLKLDGDVLVHSATFDPMGLLDSREALRVPSLMINQVSGEIEAVGSGTTTTVRRDRNGALSEQFGSQPFARSQEPTEPVDEEQLTYLQIQFSGGIVGNHLRRRVEFVRDVDTIFGQVADWDQTLDRDTPLHSAPVDHARLLCDRLVVTQWTDGADQNPSLEIQGLGNAYMSGRGFEATGAKVAYSQARDMILLEGDQHAYAKLVRQAPGSTTPHYAEAMKLTYWRSLNRIEADGAHMGNYSHTGKLKPPSRTENR